MAALTLRKAAKELGVHHTTLARWIRDGVGPRAFIQRHATNTVVRIRQADFEEFIRRRSRGGR